MLSFEQMVDKGTSLSIWTLPKLQLKIVDLAPKGLDYVYIYENIKGGKQIIVGADGKVLAFSSSISLDRVIADIKNNNLWQKAVDIATLK